MSKQGTLAGILGFSVLVAACLAAEPGQDGPVLEARRLMAGGDFSGARTAFERLLKAENLSSVHASIVRLHRAECLAAEGDWDDAVKAYQEVIDNPIPRGDSAVVAPTHHIEEARERIEQIRRVKAGQPQWTEPARTELPDISKVVLGLHVAPYGSDQSKGTVDQPFATLERARDQIRSLRQAGRLGQGAVEIIVRGGRYPLTRTFELTSADSGSEGTPVVFRAAKGESPVFTGGVTIRAVRAVSDDSVRSRLPLEAAKKVREIDLAAHGLTNLGPLTLGGFASGRGFKTHPVLELYYRGKPLEFARGPNDGFCTVASVTDAEPFTLHGMKGSKVGRFTYDGDLADRWKSEDNLLLYGYWFFGWADSYELVKSIDPEKNEVVLEPPYHGYGYRKGQWFYAVNAVSELDRPGEWCLDAARSRAYFIPPESAVPDGPPGDYEISAAKFTMVRLKDASHVRFEDLTWEMGCADGISIEGGKACVLAGCTIRRLAGSGISISDGEGHVLLSCDVYSLGRGGVSITGGNRKTLSAGRHVVENCHIYELSRIDHTYTPAVVVSGVGHRIRRNWFHDVLSSAIRVGGNDHLIEFNEVNHVVLESDDQGGVDMWGDPTFLGNVYRYNYFHHIGNWRRPDEGPDCGQAGIRLDDAISGVLIYRNLFDRCSAGKLGFGGVQIHGGKDNVIDANVFSNCRYVISFSSWGQERWLEFVKSKRQSGEIDPALYRSRYESWDRQEGQADVNWIWRNMGTQCGTFLYRNSRNARPFGNLIDIAKPAAATKPGRFDPMSLPVEQTGLYTNGFRKEVQQEMRTKMRKES